MRRVAYWEGYLDHFWLLNFGELSLYYIKQSAHFAIGLSKDGRREGLRLAVSDAVMVYEM